MRWTRKDYPDQVEVVEMLALSCQHSMKAIAEAVFNESKKTYRVKYICKLAGIKIRKMRNDARLSRAAMRI